MGVTSEYSCMSAKPTCAARAPLSVALCFHTGVAPCIWATPHFLSCESGEDDNLVSGLVLGGGGFLGDAP